MVAAITHLLKITHSITGINIPSVAPTPTAILTAVLVQVWPQAQLNAYLI